MGRHRGDAADEPVRGATGQGKAKTSSPFSTLAALALGLIVSKQLQAGRAAGDRLLSSRSLLTSRAMAQMAIQ